MSSAFTRLSRTTLETAISGLLCPRIEATLEARGKGHCIRVTDLDDNIMESICKELRRARPDGNIFILGSHDQEGQPYRITSTKLVELRNPDALGELRQPLLVFIPTSLRTSAEDSFGVATFEELTFTGIYEELTDSLLAQIPATLVGSVRDILNMLAEEDWLFADEVSRVRYLLTVLQNGIDGETLGASLYELTLIPDFRLFADLGLVTGKIHRNLDCVRSLISSHKSVRGRIAELGLSDQALEGRLFTFFDRFDIQEPESWTRTIAIDKSWWSISFDKWLFEEELSLDKILLTVLETDLPVIDEDDSDEKFSGLVGQQVLTPNERRKMNVVFEVNRHPSKVQGLDHFTVQIVSQNDGPVGKSKKVKSWRPNRLKCTTSLGKLNKIEFEEGWHFVRVLPWTADGDPIPLDSDTGSESSKRSFESEPFYVLPGASLEEDPPQRAIPIEQSLDHAFFRLKLTALGDERDPAEIASSGSAWAEGSRTKRSSHQEILLAKFGREGTVQIPVSRMLKSVEQRILSEPKHPSGWRMQVSFEDAEPPTKVPLPLPASGVMNSFLASREEFFSSVRNGTAELIMQGHSIHDSDKECIAYAETYLDLLKGIMRQAETTTGAQRQHHLRVLRNVLAVDSVHVINTDFRGNHKEAVLVSPTHPLRALWLRSWATLGNNWIGKIKSGGRDYIPHVRSALLEGLSPSAYPVAVPVEDGRTFTSVDNLNNFWALYAPTTEQNPRGLMAEVCSALGFGRSFATTPEITGSVLAEKLRRFLSQHPYVRQLSLNVFNPGTGAVLADALLELQKQREHSDLRYDIRLFSSDPDSPITGESIEELYRSDTTTRAEADAFSVPARSHLFSKLNVAKHSLSEFHANPTAFSAHISFLLDLFPAEELSAIEKPQGIVPLYGLVQDFDTVYIEDESGTFWNKWPKTGSAHLPSSTNPYLDLLPRLGQQVSFATAAVATDGAHFDAVPMLTLGLNLDQRELIFEVHQVSDWVITLDRNMGIEFFDHGRKKNRPDYLIDFVPNAAGLLGTHNLMISSRSSHELEAMLKPVLVSHGLSADAEQSIQVLSNLRSLSGQLALKLISAPTQQAEALGLALARLYLEYQGALSNQIIVPLDSHLDLYQSSIDPANTEDSASLQRTDLALFDLNLEQRTITCNLVEVKCYSQVGDFSAFALLKEKIAAQINQSERVIQRHFDPGLKSPDRPDRLLKNREFASMLRFYLDRSIRYEIFDELAAQEAKSLLDSIDFGYTLQFHRSALVFDFKKAESGEPESEVGIEFHRIGIDRIKALLEGCRVMPTEEVVEVRPPSSLSEQFIPSVPKLESAAFLVPKRDRSTQWTMQDHEASEPIVQQDQCEGSSNEVPSKPDESSYSAVNEPKPDTTKRKTRQRSQPDKLSLRLKEPRVAEKPDSAPGCEIKTKYDADAQARDNNPSYDILLGTSGPSPQYGLLGEVSGRNVALDLNHTNTISLFGVQGGGKSYTLGTIIEMATMEIPHVNLLPSPLATVVFHYSPTQDYAPEFTSMIRPNSEDKEVSILEERFSATPAGLHDVVLLTSRDKVDSRQSDYPGMEIRPIAFSSAELKAAHWKFLMGAIGSQSMYMRQINLIMRGLRDKLTLESIRAGIESSALSDHLKQLAETRLNFAAEYIDDTQRLQDVIRPGRLIIVDLRDEYIEKDEALGLFVVMMEIFSEALFEGKQFNKLVVFDEAHKYIESDDLVSGLIEVVREMRHKGTSILVASQDPPSVPVSLIELSSQIILHKFNSPAWLKHIQKANAALGDLSSDKMSSLKAGEAYVWSSKASDEAFSRSAIRIRCRPRVTAHGGATKTAVADGSRDE